MFDSTDLVFFSFDARSIEFPAESTSDEDETITNGFH